MVLGDIYDEEEWDRDTPDYPKEMKTGEYGWYFNVDDVKSAVLGFDKNLKNTYGEKSNEYIILRHAINYWFGDVIE